MRQVHALLNTSGQQAQADFDAKAGQKGSVDGRPLGPLKLSASWYRQTLYVWMKKGLPGKSGGVTTS
jgi:hypothetical protein